MHDATAPDYRMRPDQVYFLITKLELSHALWVSLQIAQIAHMPVTRVRPSMRLSIGVVVWGKWEAAIHGVRKVAQLVDVKGVLAIRGEALEPPVY